MKFVTAVDGCPAVILLTERQKTVGTKGKNSHFAPTINKKGIFFRVMTIILASDMPLLSAKKYKLNLLTYFTSIDY